MIQANELRLGNLLTYWGMEVVVSHEHIAVISRGKESYKPIPLTEEWLLKFGFESRYKFLFDTEFKGQRLLIHLDRSDAGKNNEWFVKIGSITDLPIATIQYVHQLQNLYFAYFY